MRSDTLSLTVNDLLVLYRAIHAATYNPDPVLHQNLIRLAKDPRIQDAANAALEAFDEANPTILIPVDASLRDPKERVYPMSFEVRLQEMDLLEKHEQVVAALRAYEAGEADFNSFDSLQRDYLSVLAAFGQIMSHAKEIAVMGESASVGTIKLLANMPVALQRLLDGIPGRFDVLNDLIKGREVFSNVGVVAPTSTLTRFITAKDDNEKKTLAWGVITDADGTMRISLRDFRPHVKMLMEVGHTDMAQQLTVDYLDAYAKGLNRYIADLYEITRASRETQEPQ
jgi:hypothetical protein